MLPRALKMLVSLLIAGLFAHGTSTVAAQPTFGRPKRDSTRTVPSGPAAVPQDAPKKADPIPEWREDDPPRKAPSADAKPGEIYAWKTTDGIRYAWSLPFNFEAGKPYNIIIMLPPAGMDFRWGLASHKRVPAADGGFRPDDVVLCIDGAITDPSRGRGGPHWFDVTPAGLTRFRDVMLELTRELPVKHLYLYGSGGIDETGTRRLATREAAARSMPSPTADDPAAQRPPEQHVLSGGGAFAAAFAASYPALCDGLLVHASGITPRTAVNSSVPIVFLHGAKDSLTPPAESFAARAQFAEKKHPCVRLRVMRGFNDYPNPVRASECLDFIDGMRTDDAAEILACAHRLLTPKSGDEFDYTAPVWYAGAYEILGRLTLAKDKGSADLPFPPPAEISDAQREQARAWQSAIDAEAKVHTQAITKLLAASDLRTLPLDGGPWLGYLLAFREDLRAVPASEALVKTLDFDAVAAEHAAIAEELLTAWHDHAAPSDAADRYREVTDRLPHCFLYEPLPVEMVPYLRACTRKAGELGLTPDEKDKFEYATLWDTGWRDGLEAYAERWRQWETPAEIPKPKPKEEE